MPKATYVPCLLQLFRQYGYDGATLSKISEATGLGKASLYHHFPGGKDEMAAAVLEHLEDWLTQNILQPLASPGDTITRLQCMCDRLTDLYEGGKQPCVFAILLLGSARDVFHSKVQALFRGWIDAIAAVLVEAGLERDLAQQRGEDAVIAVQGALILSQALDNPSPFLRVMQHLPVQLCQRLPSSNPR